MPKVLIVDDSLSVRRALEQVLRAQHFDVTSARSGAEALEHVAAALPDLVLADVIMPGIGGFELCRRLRARDPQIPVILISGVSDAQTERQAHAVGAAAVIAKPFTPEVLSTALSAALRPPEPAQSPGLQKSALQAPGALQDTGSAAVPLPAATDPLVRRQDAASARGSQSPDPQNPERQNPAPQLPAELQQLDLLGVLARFLEKPEVLAATLSDRQGVCVAHVGGRAADAPALANYGRFLLIASDVLGTHFGAEYSDGVAVEFPHATFYLSRVDEQYILSLYLSDIKVLGVVRYLSRKLSPDLAAGLRTAPPHS